MFPFATLMIAVTVLLATRIKPCGILIVLIASLAIVAVEMGVESPRSRSHVKIAQFLETFPVHRS
jgi:hypothetical protein